MRKCVNCFDGHFNLSERGEELYCNESGFFEELVSPDHCCDIHRFIPGYEDEKNYIYYDESYMAPGYVVIQKSIDGTLKNFIKFYITSNEGFPEFAIRGYEKGLDKDCENGIMTLSFRDIEDDENGLYDIFTKLCTSLNGKKVYSVNRTFHNGNNMQIVDEGKVTRLIMEKDFLSAGDYFDLLIGDDYTCENYDAFFKFYNELGRATKSKLKDEEVKKLLLRR